MPDIEGYAGEHDADDGAFAGLVRAAAPPAPAITGAVLTELHALSRTTVGLRRRTSRRRWLLGTAAVAALVGAGAGGAAVGSQPLPWADWGKETTWATWVQHPAASLTYTLPGGGACEQRIGRLAVAEPAGNDVVEHFMRTTDLVAGADIPAALATVRSENASLRDDHGRPVPGGYGTASYNADYEYVQAVTRAVQLEIEGAAHTAGFTVEGYSWDEHCTGETW